MHLQPVFRDAPRFGGAHRRTALRHRPVPALRLGDERRRRGPRLRDLAGVGRAAEAASRSRPIAGGIAAFARSPRWSSSCIDLVFGGRHPPGAVSTAWSTRLASLPLLVVALWRLRTPAARRVRRWIALALLAAMVPVPVIQIIPLPPDLWSSLARSRLHRRELCRAAGCRRPGCRSASRPTRRRTSSLVVHSARPPSSWPRSPRAARSGDGRPGHPGLRRSSPSVLGMLQVLGGPESQLRFYAFTNSRFAVGFFANRNHEAALSGRGLALRPAVDRRARSLGEARMRGSASRSPWPCKLVLVVGIGVTHSRAGVLIGLAVLAAGAALSRSALGERSRRTRRAALALLAAGVRGARWSPSLRADARCVRRFHAPLVDHVARAQTAPWSAHAAEPFFPFGSGLGSFDPVYRAGRAHGARHVVLLQPRARRLPWSSSSRPALVGLR